MDKPIAWYDPTNGAVSTDKDSPLFTPLGQVLPLYTEQDCVGWFGYDTGLRLWFEANKGDDGAIPLYKARSNT